VIQTFFDFGGIEFLPWFRPEPQAYLSGLILDLKRVELGILVCWARATAFPARLEFR
jgi:hypothetical protein